MQQTISREEREVQDRRRTATKQLGADSSAGLYEQFLQMPVPVVLAALWLVGAALLSVGLLTLYALGTVLALALGV